MSLICGELGTGIMVRIFFIFVRMVEHVIHKSVEGFLLFSVG